MSYVPSTDSWQTKRPTDVGMHPDAIAAAIAYHQQHESPWRRDFLTASGRYIGVADEPETENDVLGPVRPRGGPNGIVLRHGYGVAERGHTGRVDISFSIADSFLTTEAGLAAGRGLIKSA